MAGLDKVVSDLDKQEKSIYTLVRPPLEQNRPLQDSADRLQEMKVMTRCLFLTLSIIFLCPVQLTNHNVFISRTLLQLSLRLNQRRPLRCRKRRASWPQTQVVPVHLSFTARWMRQTRSTPKLSSFFRALRRSRIPYIFFLL